jgi:cytochrome P450
VTESKFKRRWPEQGYIPDHIPADLIRHHDILTDSEARKCPFSAITKLRDGPRTYWNPESFQFGGAWYPTKAEDIRFILGHPDLFSNRHEAGFSALVGEEWDLVPLELDPPEHGAYRRLLNPLMAPPVIAKLAPQVVARAVELIDRFVDEGECEFMEAFGRPFPISIFMELMGLPADMTDEFNRWEFELLHHPDMAVRVRAAHEINDFLLDLAARRRADPVDDLTSKVVMAQVDGKPLSDDRVIGILYLLFVGGLDTVASSLGFFFRHLAEHPDDQDRLRQHPEQIPHAVEELLRRYSVVSVNRQCVTDVEVGGAHMKAGDWISIMTPLASTDPAEFDRPLDVDLDRRTPRHLAFSFGPHFCMGSHLARRELIVALEQWLAHVPPFRIKDGEDVIAHGSGVFGIDHMVLTWK